MYKKINIFLHINLVSINFTEFISFNSVLMETLGLFLYNNLTSENGDSFILSVWMLLYPFLIWSLWVWLPRKWKKVKSLSRVWFCYSMNCRLAGSSIWDFLGKNMEKAMAPHSSTLAWKIPWMEEPGGLQSIGSLRVGHDCSTSLSLFTFMHWRRKWQPTPVFLPGEPQGWPSMGSHRVGHDCSDLAAAAAGYKYVLYDTKNTVIFCKNCKWSITFKKCIKIPKYTKKTFQINKHWDNLKLEYLSKRKTKKRSLV